MRYAAAEKLEIIRLVEQPSLSVRRTLGQLGIPRSIFYCWYDRYRARDDDAAISYGVNILVADADEHAATSFLHGARVQFTAGRPLRDSLKNRIPNLATPRSI
jgi:transposase-like protein